MISSLLNTSYYLYRSPTHFLLTSNVSFYLLTDCAPTLSIDSPVHFNFLFSILSNLPDCVTPRFLYHLNLPAIVIAPLSTGTRGYSALLARQQACQPVNLLDGHGASQSLCFCVKTLIKKSRPWSGQWPDNLSTPSSFPLIGPRVFSVSFSALRLFQAHPFPAELKDRSDKKHY